VDFTDFTDYTGSLRTVWSTLTLSPIIVLPPRITLRSHSPERLRKICNICETGVRTRRNIAIIDLTFGVITV